MRIFMAGATGVIGRGAVPLLLAAGHDVTAVGRSPAKRDQLHRLGARAVAVDLFDPAAVRRAIEGMEVVINLATAIPEGAGVFLPWPWRMNSRVRREVSANLVAAALENGTVRRVVQESFAPVYQDGGDAWLDERAPVQPARYNRAILDAEAAARRFADLAGSGVVLRFGMFYGPDDAMTAQLIDSVRRGWFPLFGRPDAYASWLHHRDAAAAVVAALEVPSGIYNVVEDRPRTRQELADGLARRLGVARVRLLPPWARYLGGVIGETVSRSVRISNRKFRLASGWAPEEPDAIEGFARVAGAVSTPSAVHAGERVTPAA